MKKLKFGEIKEMELVCNNEVALHIASNSVFHERTKHIEIDCHFVKGKALGEDIIAGFMQINDHLSDIFIKSLNGSTT